MAARQEQNDHLHVRSHPLNYFLPPDLQVLPLYREHGHGLGLVIKLKKDFLEHLDQCFCLLVVPGLIKDAPLLYDRLVKKLILCQAQGQIFPAFFDGELEPLRLLCLFLGCHS